MNIICQKCQTSFETFPSWPRKYCSQLCASQDRIGKTCKKNKLRSDRGTKRCEYVKKLCAFCKNDMLVKPSLAKRKNYCCRTHYELHKRVLVKGENNPAWNGGTSYQKRGYRGEDWEIIRRRIYARDNWTCTECNVKCISRRAATPSTTHLIIQCHHNKKYRISRDNSDINLRTVCLRCHGKVENNE